MIKRLLTFSFLAVTISANAQTINKVKLDSVLDALAANNKSMGSLAVTQNGKIIYQKAVGYSAINGADKTQSTLKTKYRIGSISKMFTGVMVFQLIDEGKLTLDTKLAQFYPQIANADKITIGNMLSHHSGLHNFTNDPEYRNYMSTPQTHAQMLARIVAMKSDFEPGSKEQYSNTNFVLLAYIVEQLTGKTYAEAVKQRVINKIGLKDTYYGTKTHPADNEAYSYSYEAKAWKQRPETDMSIPSGAGSMVSTPADLDLFINALFNGKLVSAASLEKMKTPQDKLGMAMMSMPFYEKTGYGHGGSIDGFLSTLGYFPNEKIAFCYIKNGGDYPINDIAIAALSACFNKPFSVPTFSKIEGGDLAQYTGIYASPGLPIKITITKEGSSLIAQATGQSAFPLDATATPGEFKYDAAGVVMEFSPATSQFTLKQGGGQFVFTKEK